MRHKPSILEHCDWADETDMGLGSEQPVRVTADQLAANSIELLRLAVAVGDIGLWQWDHAAGEVTFDDRAAAILSAQGTMRASIAELRAAAHPADLQQVIDPEMAAYVSGSKPI